MQKFSRRAITKGALVGWVTKVGNSNAYYFYSSYDGYYTMYYFYEGIFRCKYNHSGKHTYTSFKESEEILIGKARDILDAKLKGIIK